MKYKVGDKVRYDGGDWWFYATVSAVFEHSISPCYRLSVYRMEKKSCKFSITQFEFELEAYNEEVGNGREKREWKNTEIELLKKYYGVLGIDDLSKMLDRSSLSIEDKWLQIKPVQEQVQVQVPEQETMPEKKKRGRRKQKQETEQIQEAEPELETTQKPKRGRRRDAWYINFEMYRNGEKSNAISTWIAQNRREYKTGKLKEDKLDKLLGINFPFEVVRKKKLDNWDNRLEEWKKGERRSKFIQQWKQRSIKQYTEGNLSIDRIAKLKEVGILK